MRISDDMTHRALEHLSKKPPGPYIIKTDDGDLVSWCPLAQHDYKPTPKYLYCPKCGDVRGLR